MSSGGTVLQRPSNIITGFKDSGDRVCVWLSKEYTTRFEGKLLGFDEFLNLVLDDTVEINMKNNTRTNAGRLLLKGDQVGVIHAANSQ